MSNITHKNVSEKQSSKFPICVENPQTSTVFCYINDLQLREMR
jgi:hypothetical protein